jgi:hypothetical protein
MNVCHPRMCTLLIALFGIIGAQGKHVLQKPVCVIRTSFAL